MSRGKEMTPEELARRLAAIADDKKATDLVALDVRSLVSYTDYLVICTARNERQAKAIHDEVYHQLKRDGWLPARVEGEREAEWVLMDYLDAVLHIFTPELRERYRLEVLWGEAERLDLDLAARAAPPSRRGRFEPNLRYLRRKPSDGERRLPPVPKERFRRALRGYDPEEVDAAIDARDARLARLEREAQRLAERVVEREKKLQEALRRPMAAAADAIGSRCRAPSHRSRRSTGRRAGRRRGSG